MNTPRLRGVWLGSFLTVLCSLFLAGCQSLSAGGSGGGGSVVAANASLAFGTVAVGSSKTLADTLSNNTAASVTISSISGSSTDLQVLGISQPLVLGAGQSVPFSVKFQPSATGNLSRTISLLGSNSNVIVSLTASGTSTTPTSTGPGQLSLTPSSVAFGSIKAGSSKTNSVTLSNSGGTDLTVNQATLSGAGFSTSNLSLPLTLHAGGTASLSVTFAPTGSGSFTGKVTFATSPSGDVVLPLSGTGIAPGQLTANPSSLAFGSVQVGNSSSKSETLTNTSGTAVTISQANVSGAGFSVSGLSLPVTLAANQSVPFTVSFAPTTAAAASATLAIVSDAVGSPLNLALSGTGLAAGSLTANPSTASFGNVTVGNNKTVSVTVTNTGGATVTVSSAAASGSGFSFTGPTLPLTLNAGQSTAFSAIFAPAAAGASSGTLKVNSNASNATLSVPLSGTGLAQGQLSPNPSSFSFGNVQVGSSKSLSETLTNSGGTTLTISAATAGSSGFSLSGLTVPVTLNAGQSTSFTVLFAPTASGAASGNISIASNGANPNLSIPLSGTGVTPGTLAANPTSLSFGSVQVGNSSTKSETLTNAGGTALTISAASVSGNGFSLSGLTSPVTLNAGQSTSFTVRFAPAASGAANGNVSITANASDSNLTIAVSGTGITPGQASPNPSSFSFGSVQTGNSKSLSGTLTNSGETSLTISAAAASGSGFSLSGLAVPFTLNAGQSASFTALFAPTASGAASGNISIASNGANPNLSIPLSGTGVTPGTLAANPASLSFGSVQVGNSSSKSETLTNAGGTALTISAASVSGSGFSLSGLTSPVTLNAGQSTSFTVRFAPAASGAANGNVSITANASDSNLTIAVSGTGITPGQVSPNPSSFSFGSVQTGNSKSLSGTLTNSGETSLTISAAAASGSGFSLSGLTVPVTLNAGQSASFTALFAPTASGAASGSISITSNGSNPNLSIPLSGTGVTPGTLAANPTSLAFPSVPVGNSSSKSETVTNTGGSTVTLSQANVTGAVFSVSGLTLPATLSSNQSVTFTVIFTPASAGSASGTVSIVSDASNSPLSIALSGTGTAPGQLAVSPATLSFGNVVVGSSSSLNGTLNATGAAVTISSDSIANEFTLSGISLPATIAAGSSASFTVTVTPKASGATSGSLSFTSNATNSPTVQSLTGSGTPPPQHSVDLTWNSATNAVGYNVYRGTTSGGPYSIVNASLDASAAFTDDNVTAGQTYYYVVTAVDGSSNESGYSNQAVAVIPSP
ncbi:MAG TPA: choice-of-anchor D domain-containing protein [Terriglobales bacterium]